MSRRITRDDAALLLLRLEPEDGAAAEPLADALARLSRQRGCSVSQRERLRVAGECVREWIVSGSGGEAALAAAGAALEDRDVAAPPVVAPVVTPASAAAAAAAMLADFDKVYEPPAVDADPELLEAFVGESVELLQQAEAMLLELEHDPGDRERLNTVFRCFHTIKGTSSFLGLDHVGRLAHGAESMLSQARDGRLQLTGPYADLALRSIDLLSGGIQAARVGGPRPAGMDALHAELEAAARGVSASEAVATTSPVETTAQPVEGTAKEADGADAWVRVRTDRLDQLVEMVGELVIAHAMIAQDPNVGVHVHDGLTRKVGHSGKIVRELQDLSISMRMVPLKPLFQRLARVARDAAQRTGKQLSFHVRGEDTELDRTMVAALTDPLVHMIRNAVDHGIEEPEVRAAAGKPREGRIEVAAYHAGGSLVVELSDDGAGLDRDRIIEKALRQGLAERDRNYSDSDVFELIFAPGFSTAAEVTALSGRGVGMDVVRRGVESLRGRIQIQSVHGQGSTFSIRLPLTLAITDGMLVRVGEERFIIPTVNIQVSFRPTAKQITTVAGHGEVVLLRDELFPVLRLHRLFDIDSAETKPEHALLVIAGTGERHCALLVDELMAQQQVVAKTLGSGLGKVAGISGGAILGDGRVGLILDLGELLGLARDARAA